MSAPQRVSRPVARYRPGQAPVGSAGNEYDSDDSQEEQQEQQLQPQEVTDLKSFSATRPAERRTAGVIINLEAKSEPKQQQETEYDSDEYETDTDEEEAKPAVAANGRAGPSTLPKKPASESEYETDSEEESSEESEEEEKPMFKPMFVPKNQRKSNVPQPDPDQAAKETAELEAKAEAEAAKRRMESQRLAGERIKLELMEKQAQLAAKPDLDDTDGLDPESEFSAWRLRELQRIKREWEKDALREEEEGERRKREAMTEEERLAVDSARADKTRKEKDENRGKMGFLDKYYHKGAFFQDLDIVNKRDYSGPTEGAIDKSTLPKLMQKRDYGKRGQSKYTHLAAEDTSRSGLISRGGPSSTTGGCFHCGATDHMKKDCPVLTAERQQEREQRHQQRPRDAGFNGKSRYQDADAPGRSRDAGWQARPRREADDPRGRSRSPPPRPPRDSEGPRYSRPHPRDGGSDSLPTQSSAAPVIDRWAMRQEQEKQKDVEMEEGETIP